MRSPYGLDLVENCQACPLRSNGFFCDLPTAVLMEFKSIKFTMAYPQGSMLFVEGGQPRSVFVLCKGKVKLSMTSAQGKTLILRIAQPGDILGVESAVSGNPFVTTAETLEPCQTNIVRLDKFLSLLRKHVAASLHAAQELGRSHTIACEQIRTLGFKESAPGKLARFLLDWTKKGQQTNKGTRVRLALTHEEIGQVIGVSRETVTRVFGDFRSKHLVVFHGSTLRIQNRQGLENLVVL